MTDDELKKILNRYKTRYFDMDGKPLTLDEWGSYLEDRNFNRHIGDEEINGYRISTVWMGLDHSFFGDSDPLIFETMIFARSDMVANEELDGYQERYSTKEQAIQGHKIACELVRQTTK